MRRPSAICKPFDVVVVPFPFPFPDQVASKKRPVLVLSSEAFNRNGHSILAMITTKGHSPWPGDCSIADLEQAGLRVPCIFRPKLFTLDNRLIIRTLGRLSQRDQNGVSKSLGEILGPIVQSHL